MIDEKRLHRNTFARQATEEDCCAPTIILRHRKSHHCLVHASKHITRLRTISLLRFRRLKALCVGWHLIVRGKCMAFVCPKCKEKETFNALCRGQSLLLLFSLLFLRFGFSFRGLSFCRVYLFFRSFECLFFIFLLKDLHLVGELSSRRHYQDSYA